MERYLRKNRLSEAMDGLGVRAALLAAGVGWFTWLWGLSWPAVTAGCALGVMGMRARSLLRRRSVKRREQALRRSLGAELLLEELLLIRPGEAHSRCAALLMRRWPLALLRETEAGVLARQGEEKLLIRCVQTPPEGEVGHGDLYAAQRALREAGADRAVLCLTGRLTPRMAAKAEAARRPVKLIRREVLLTLAGEASPATDEQLVALGERKRRPAREGRLLSVVFRREKAARYMGYGLLLLTLYEATGVRLYAVPGMVCLTLGTLSRTGRGGQELL